MMRRFLEDQGADENDPKANIGLLSKWLNSLNSESILKEALKSSHLAMRNAQKLMNKPTCGPEEMPLMNNLRKIRKCKTQLYADHIDNIIDEVTDQYADKCRSTLTANIVSYLGNLEPDDKTSLIALANKMENSWFDPDSIVAAVYGAISAHVEDPLIGSILPKTKSKHLTLKQFNSIYTKYAFEPCERMRATANWLEDGLALDAKLVTSEEGSKGPINTFDLASQSCDLILSNKCPEGIGRARHSVNWVIYGDLKEAVKTHIETTTGTKISNSILGGRR